MPNSIDLVLDRRWSQLLAQIPETGMGFHLVDIILGDGRTLESIPVFNLDHACLPPEVGPLAPPDIAEMRLHDNLRR